jgi:queuine tRNA-ribosyltransferase
VIFRWEDDRKLVLTPEKSIQSQFRLGSDVMVAMDDCTDPAHSKEEQALAVERTVQWTRRARLEFDRQLEQRRSLVSRPLLVGVVQGGPDPALRRTCAEALGDLELDAFGYGGWPIDEEGRFQIEDLAFLAGILPREKPRFALGVGKPEHVVAVARLPGDHVFDSSLPTRDGRRGRLYSFVDRPGDALPQDAGFYERVYIFDEQHGRDERNLDPSCDGPCCTRYSRAYLQHLFKMKDSLGPRIGTLHNLRFLARLMERLAHEQRPQAVPLRA